MHVTHELNTDLAQLAVALDESGVDQRLTLEALTNDLMRSTPLVPGIVVTLRRTDGPAVVLPAQASRGASRAETPISLVHKSRISVFVGIIFLRTTPREIVTGPSIGSEAFELHLRVSGTNDPDLAGFAEFSELNQAIGALLDRDLLPEEAHAELARRADYDHGTVEQAARQLLDEMNSGSPLPTAGGDRWNNYLPRQTSPQEDDTAESLGGGDDFVRWLITEHQRGLPEADLHLQPHRSGNLDPESSESMIETFFADAGRRLGVDGRVSIAATSVSGGIFLSARAMVVRRVQDSYAVEARFGLDPLAADLVPALTFLARFAQIRGGQAWIDPASGTHSGLKIWIPVVDGSLGDDLQAFLD